MFEYERLKQNNFSSTIKRNNISDDTITVFVLNVGSLSKHTDIVSYDRIIQNDIIGLTETQISPSDSTYKKWKHSIFSILILIAMKINI